MNKGDDSRNSKGSDDGDKGEHPAQTGRLSAIKESHTHTTVSLNIV